MSSGRNAPSDFTPRDHTRETIGQRPCPFCPGNEDAAIEPLDIVVEDGAWQIRVIPNLYPAFAGASGLVVHHLGPVHVTADATGVHEVFIYTPVHDLAVNDLSDAHAAAVMQALKRRLTEHARRRRTSATRK